MLLPITEPLKSCDLMLFDNVFQSIPDIIAEIRSCDLMLFDNVFQSRCRIPARRRSCDLMLFDNVFQWIAAACDAEAVVI